jgi:hypothetical protein
MADFLISAAGVVGSLALGAVGWVGLNFFGKPILTLKEKRREALEVGERYAYVGLHNTPYLTYDDSSRRPMPDEYQKRALSELSDAGNSLRAHFRERSLSTQIYCWVFGYDLDYAARSLLGLAEAARVPYINERARRLTLHALLVALGATHHLLPAEIAVARIEMKLWHDGNRDMTTSSSAADKT